MSKHRPACPILAITTSLDVARKLSMNWGVTAVLAREGDGDAALLDVGLRFGRERGYLESGDVVVATAGLTRQTGSTNLIRVVTVE